MAAQDAELKLKVSLDLGFFRQQLVGLGQAAAGYNMPVQVKFDRRSVQNELNALSANIKRRNYTLNVNTNLKAEIANAKTLAQELENLAKVRSSVQSGIRQQMGMGALAPGPQSGGIGSKEVGKLYKAAAKAGFLEFDKEIARTKTAMIAALELVGRDAIAGLLNGLASQDERLKTAAASIGENLIKTIKGVLGIASPSKEFKKIGEDAGKGFELGLIRAMELAEKSATNQMRRMLDRLARMALMMGGMSTAEISRQIGQARALPGVNFPATVPPRQRMPIGPSDTGRALPPGITPGALPGTAFGAQRYLPSALGEEMKRVLREAANTFLDTIRAGIRQVNVRDLGTTVSRQALLGPGRIAGMLPAAVGREPSRYAMGGESREQMMARRTAEAYARSALRGMDVMGGGAGRPSAPYSHVYRSARPMSAMMPYTAGGAIVPSSVAAGAPPSQPPSGGGGFAGMGGFARAMGGINLPGAGVIRELGSEFAFATKQVLLFGQAYKLLAFLQDFPAQVGNAVGQLQTFRNTLGAISPTADEAAASNQLILDLVDKYNVPLQSARDGFTKLYASMAPAGFSGDEIRDLFTGITQAAATFGMSADKVDRVNYAFAQMASKGQVMSEELKGQLGDVLPGAMALFAEAAGFKGPKAIQDFSAALEDGAYKGQAMVALLKNVGVVMKQEFGPGAEGAARTFQGVINRMQNSMTLLYESFEPVAVGFLNGVVVPLTAGIKQISDGFKAFFTGATAQTSGGFAIAQELERLRPAFDGISQNVSALVAQFGQFARIALEVGKVLLQIAGNPLVGYLVKLYAIALPINIALNVMRGLWAANALQLVIFNARVATGTSTLSAFRGMMSATGATAQATAASIRTAGITLRTFFATTGVGLVIVGISMLIEKFMSMNQALTDTQAKALGAADAIRSMSQTEARAAEQQAQNAYSTIGRVAGRKGEETVGPGKDRLVELTPAELKELQQVGAIQTAKDPFTGKITARRSDVMSLAPQAQRLQAQATGRIRDLRFEEKQSQQPVAIAPIPPSEGERKPEKEKRVALEELLDMESQRRMQMSMSNKELRLSELIRDAKLAGNDAEAESLQSLSGALGIQGKIRALQIFRDMLINKEDEILKKSLTKEQFNNKLQDTNVELQGLQNDLKEEFFKLQVSENEQQKKARELLDQKLSKQKELNRLIEDAQIEAGIISPQDAAVRLQRRGFEDAQAKIKAEGTPEQLTQLTAAQAFIPEAGSLQETIKTLREELDKLLSTQEMVKFSATSIGEAFSASFKNIITGTSSVQGALASFFQSVASSFADMTAKMIAEWVKVQAIKGITSIINMLNPASVFSSLSGGGALGTSGTMNMDISGTPVSGSSLGLGSITGGWFSGGSPIPQFANGGIVTGPTLGLIGEGRYNEAVIPLPDGKSIPVDLSGAAGNQIVSNITVNVSNGQAQSNATGANSSELGRKLEGAVKKVIIGELRPGGVLASR